MNEPNFEEVLQKEKSKALGLMTITFLVVVIVFLTLPPRLFGTNFVPEILAVMAILASLQAVNRRLVTCRQHFGLRAFQKKDFPQVVEILEPFLGRFLLWPNARFDRTGEVLYMLAVAFLKEGDQTKSSQITRYLARFRRGEWADKAQKLQNQATRN